MFKQFTYLFLALIAGSVHAQMPRDKDFLTTEITLENGTKVKGFIEDFTVQDSKFFTTPVDDLNPYEKKLNLDRRSFKFKKNIDEDTKTISADSIKSIAIFEDGTVTYDKIKLKTINSSNQVVDLKREIFAPLRKKGRIDLYGVKVVDQRGKLVTMLAYIKRPQEDYALIPIDMNRINLFNVWSMEERFITAFMEVTKDCDAYQAVLKDKLEKSKKGGKEYKKFQKAAYEEYMKNDLDKKVVTEDKFSGYFFTLYTNMIDEYTTLCKD